MFVFTVGTTGLRNFSCIKSFNSINFLKIAINSLTCAVYSLMRAVYPLKWIHGTHVADLDRCGHVGLK